MRPTTPFLRLSAGRVSVVLVTVTLACVLLQTAMGASWLVLAALCATMALAIGAFTLGGAYSLGAWVLLFYALGNVGVALVAKTFLGQTLDSHLFVPGRSFLVELLSMGGAVFAFLVVHQLHIGHPLLPREQGPERLRWLSWVSLLLGIVFWFVNYLSQRPGSIGFGGVSIFRVLLFMAVIARTASLMEGSGDRRQFDVPLFFIIALCVFLGLLTDRKTWTALPVVSYFVTVLFYKGRLPLRHILVLFIGAFLFVFLVAPAIHAWRYLGQEHMPVGRRVSLMVQGTGQLLEGKALGHYAKLTRSEFRHGYYDYFGGQGKYQMILGRFASVQQIDPVIAAIDHRSRLGLSVISHSLEHLVPRILDPGKPEYVEGYRILLDLGLISRHAGKYPTLPLAGDAYSAFGLAGVLPVAFMTFMALFLVMKAIGWSLYRNVYAIFFFCQFVVFQASEGTLSQYAAEVLRTVPLLLIVFWIARHSYVRPLPSELTITRSLSEK